MQRVLTHVALETQSPLVRHADSACKFCHSHHTGSDFKDLEQASEHSKQLLKTVVICRDISDISDIQTISWPDFKALYKCLLGK